MEDLRPSRPGPSAEVERYSPDEKKSVDKTVEKKIKKRNTPSAVVPVLPSLEDDGEEQDHRLDERA